MKKLAVTLMILVAFSCLSFGQQMNSDHQVDYDKYLRKSKNQRIAAFAFLGAGVIMYSIAAPGRTSWNTAAALAIGGSTSILGSIPLFILSGKNKRKAQRLKADYGMTLNIRPVFSRGQFQDMTGLFLSLRL